MTISSRIARRMIVLGISTAVVSLLVMHVPSAFAEDPMTQDIDFRNGASRADGTRKDTQAREITSRPTAKKGETTKEKYGVPK